MSAEFGPPMLGVGPSLVKMARNNTTCQLKARTSESNMPGFASPCPLYSLCNLGQEINLSVSQFEFVPLGCVCCFRGTGSDEYRSSSRQKQSYTNVSTVTLKIALFIKYSFCNSFKVLPSFQCFAVGPPEPKGQVDGYLLSSDSIQSGT